MDFYGTEPKKQESKMFLYLIFILLLISALVVGIVIGTLLNSNIKSNDAEVKEYVINPDSLGNEELGKIICVKNGFEGDYESYMDNEEYVVRCSK